MTTMKFTALCHKTRDIKQKLLIISVFFFVNRLKSIYF